MFSQIRKCNIGRSVRPRLDSVRLISSAEIATALRPFYFVVHPDLFGRYPKQRSINEESLKHLSAHLEATQQQRVPTSSPLSLAFYVRRTTTPDEPPNSSIENFRLVRLPLGRRPDTKALIRDLLKTCQLPTDFVDAIKSPTSPSRSCDGSHHSTDASTLRRYANPMTGDSFYGRAYEDEENTYRQVRKSKTLLSWLTANVETAHTRTIAMDGIRDDVTRLEKSIVERLRLADIQYDCGWNVEHYRGCLKSLSRMADMYEHDLKPLEGRTILFALCSGVSLDGHVMLFTGDVHRNWLDFIHNIADQDDYLTRIPSYEQALSQVLLGIRIARRKFMPKAQVINYAAQLRRVTTSMLDYQTYNKYPAVWPRHLADFEIVIESESGPLMVSPTGQFITPSTCSGPNLVDFLTAHMDEARQKISDYQTNKYIERELHDRCMTELQLRSLHKDDSINPTMAIGCLRRLLVSGATLGNVALSITHYYSVLADGTMCIPWDWSLE